MKTNIKNNLKENENITVFRYRVEDLEKKLLEQHETIKNEIAIPLGKDLGNMQPSKPEPECEKDVYSGVIGGAYSKMMMTAKKELQSEIESHHILADKEETKRTLKELNSELEKKGTDHRIKKREVEKCDHTLKKKAKRYRWTRIALMFLILVDTLISSAALQAMGYPLLTSYIIGLAIGIGIFFTAEHLPDIIAKGRTPNQRRAIAFVVFGLLFMVFYVLGIFRTTTLKGSMVFGNGAGAFYFACLNMFITTIAAAVVHFKGLSRNEKRIWDTYRIAEEDEQRIAKEVKALKVSIAQVHKKQKESELARTQIQIYAHDVEELIQRLYEESLKTFYSTNCIHRSDGKVPKFFEHPIAMLPSFYKGLTI
ncbi:hypothetical protein [Candidatus Ulvibacter alkanivorans]|uniref:hypothetical protein n=1 Tax=Candidatus Ulvibacter alkanivorans TaxID=2267620 RepID=UPI000DF3A089|nr:hypothetical protein [Candidatus Ulvibacter alkanivorans]